MSDHGLYWIRIRARFFRHLPWPTITREFEKYCSREEAYAMKWAAEQYGGVVELRFMGPADASPASLRPGAQHEEQAEIEAKHADDEIERPRLR